VVEIRNSGRVGENDARGGGLGGRGPWATVFCGIKPSRMSSEARFELRSSSRLGSGAFFVCAQQCADGKSRSNKYWILSKSRLGGEFLSSPGLPNTPHWLAPGQFGILINSFKTLGPNQQPRRPD
jgi:hypothetical protein